jgi:UDP-N-acetylglucosamine 4-epimerase
MQITPGLDVPPAQHAGFRAGDVRHSLADIGKASSLLGYQPSHTVREGIGEAVPWYVANARALLN